MKIASARIVSLAPALGARQQAPYKRWAYGTPVATADFANKSRALVTLVTDSDRVKA